MHEHVPEEEIMKDTFGGVDPEITAMMEDVLKADTEDKEQETLSDLAQGAKEINQHLIALMKNEEGVHAESFLCTLGSLAGYACQAGVRVQALDNDDSESEVFSIVETLDGNKYFFGEALNKPLIENRYSIWNLSVGAAQYNGATVLPDLVDICTHVAETVGEENFGILRIQEEHQPEETPFYYLKTFWPIIFPLVEKTCLSPEEWSILFGLAIQDAFEMTRATLSPEIACSIIMESAVPMSKVDFETV